MKVKYCRGRQRELAADIYRLNVVRKKPQDPNVYGLLLWLIHERNIERAGVPDSMGLSILIRMYCGFYKKARRV